MNQDTINYYEYWTYVKSTAIILFSSKFSKPYFIIWSVTFVVSSCRPIVSYIWSKSIRKAFVESCLETVTRVTKTNCENGTFTNYLFEWYMSLMLSSTLLCHWCYLYDSFIYHTGRLNLYRQKVNILRHFKQNFQRVSIYK